MTPCWGWSYVLGHILAPLLLHNCFSRTKKMPPTVCLLCEIPGYFQRFLYHKVHTDFIHLTFTLRLSGSSALPAYPGFMVMKTAQVGLRESSVPSKMNVFSFRMMACWMLRICWATTDSTSTWGESGWLMQAPAATATPPRCPRPPHLVMTNSSENQTFTSKWGEWFGVLVKKKKLGVCVCYYFP